MADFNTIPDQSQVAGASREGKPDFLTLEPRDADVSQSINATPSRHSLVKNILQESRTITKRLAISRPESASHDPPVNFAVVSEGVYRSGYPQTQDYPFIQSLKLKTIITLVNKELPGGYQEFMQANQITHRVFDMAGTKKEQISIEMMRSIIAVVSKSENHPLLIHCNHGKHRTGCVVGVFRKSNQWDMKHIVEEYSAFAAPKSRETDLKYLTEFELTGLCHQPHPVTLPNNTLRFFRFVMVAVVTLFVFYPLSKFKAQEPRPKLG